MASAGLQHYSCKDFWCQSSINRCVFTGQQRRTSLFWDAPVTHRHPWASSVLTALSKSTLLSQLTPVKCAEWSILTKICLSVSPMLHHLLLCTMDINTLAKIQECPGWTIDSFLPGEPSFLPHVRDFSPQLLKGEQLPSPVFSSPCFYTWTRFPKEHFLPWDKRAFSNRSSSCMDHPHAETLLCRGGGMHHSMPFCLLCFLTM